MDNRKYTGIILLGMALFFYCMNSFMPYYDDDIWYAYRYVPQETLSPIHTVSDILVSQYHHYIGEQSRAVVHILLQTLMSLLPDWAFDLLNTAIFILLLGCIVRYTAGKTDRNPALDSLIAFVAVFCLLPDMDYLFYWAAGALNYLWPSVATLLFLLFWQKIPDRQHPSTLRAALCIGAAFLCAFSHEALSLPVGAALCIQTLLHRRRIGNNLATYVVVAYLAGCLFLLLSPSVLLRINRMIPDADKTEYISLAIDKFRHLRALPLLCMLVLLSACRARWRKSFRRFCGENRFLVTICIVAVPLAFYVGSATSNMRAFYGAEFYSMLFLLRFCNSRLRPRIARFSSMCTVALSVALLLWAIPVSVHSRKVGQQHKQLFTGYRESPDGMVYISGQSPATILRPWVMDLRKRYLYDYESEWRTFVIPLAQTPRRTMQVPRPLLSRDAAGRYKLYGAYIRILPAELRTAVENPEKFFVPANKMKGNNPFYSSPHSGYMIAPLDSIPPSSSWQWIYGPVSWKDPSASVSGFLRRLLMPATFPLSEPVLWIDTIQSPAGQQYATVRLPAFRQVNAVSPLEQKPAQDTP